MYVLTLTATSVPWTGGAGRAPRPPARSGVRPALANVLPLTRERDLYLAPLSPGQSDPEAAILLDRERPLAFYAVDDPAARLRPAKTASGTSFLRW